MTSPHPFHERPRPGSDTEPEKLPGAQDSLTPGNWRFVIGRDRPGLISVPGYDGVAMLFHEAIARALADNGVTTVFGLPGGPLFPIYDALLDCPSIRVVHCKHETMAVFAAAAYARATESVGVVLVTSGPGITNALTGLASAFYSRAIAVSSQRPWSLRCY